MSFFRDIGRMILQEQEKGIKAPVTDTVIHSLSNEDTLAKVFELSDTEPVVIFKHSASCLVSAMARRRLLHLDQESDPSIYELVVQSARPLSQKLEQHLGIRHESPQVIILYKQQPLFDTSHGMITVDHIRAAIEQATEAE